MNALSLPPGMPRSQFSVRYAQKDVTRELAAHLIALTYTDYLTDQSDELELELEDVDGRWRNAWYPGKGDTLEVEIGWQGQDRVRFGTFQIDEIEFTGGPSTVCIRALAASIGQSLRTTEHVAYENTTLSLRTTEHVAYENTTLDAVASRIAKRHGLNLTGKIEPIALERLTQAESDGVFLSKLAGEYDYAFKVVGDRLVFHAIAELMAADPIASVAVTDFAPGWRIRDQIKDVPKSATVKSHNPATGKMVSYTVNNDGVVVAKPAAAPGSLSKTTTSADTAKRTSRTITLAQADAKALCELARANREQTQGYARMQGRPHVVAGSVLALTGAGKLDGNYLIQASRHCLSREGGYTTDIEFCRVREAQGVTNAAPTASKPAKKPLAVYGITDGQVTKQR